MKLSNIKYLAVASLVCLGMSSCEDYLDKPAIDSYNKDNYYQTEDQCESAVYYLYNSPWYDFQRGYFKVGEELAGNLYEGNSPFVNFTVNGSDKDLTNAAYSLWAEVGHANTVYNNICSSPVANTETAQYCKGECLTWKAMAYFYLVRIFGDIPIVHNNADALESGSYTSIQKVDKDDVYEYIIMTLEEAIKLLPEEDKAEAGRIDKLCASGLLAKVYLTRAGVNGSINQEYLDQAVKYAKPLLDPKLTTRRLLPEYKDVFLLANNKSQESLIALRWTANGNVWTAQNSLQCDLGMKGFSEFGDCWGDWVSPSVDLQQAFGVQLCEQQPDAWINHVDSRLKATMMLPGFKYSYFWQDKEGGFDYMKFLFDKNYNTSAPGTLNSSTGANCVKHLYGDAFDHKQGAGHSAAYMYNSLATHLLRLSDVYLVYAEAKCGGRGSSTDDDDAIDAFYEVHKRAVPTATRPSVITWDDIWNERRLEFALEGDRWYDYVRVSYYDPDFCIEELRNQKRDVYYNLGDTYKTYQQTGQWVTDATKQMYNPKPKETNPIALTKIDSKTGKRYLLLPFPTEDVNTNPYMGSSYDGIHVDVRKLYPY